MLKILLIEDEHRLRETIAELIELYNYEVETAHDGLVGFEKSIQFKPDLILCDVMMPNLNGFEFIIKIKQSPMAHIPVILLSAKVDKEDVENGIKLGATSYIKKPFLTKELIEKIERYILR